MVVGAALTSWRLSSYGRDKVDRGVLRFLSWFFSVGVLLWFVSPFSAYATAIALATFGLALFIVLIGGIPGLRLSVPTGTHDRIVKEQVLIWAVLIIAVIVWQKLA